jgi:phosphotransferase system  glucose/maltose/N-acetylglucosamine-specific IIC component
MGKDPLKHAIEINQIIAGIIIGFSYYILIMYGLHWMFQQY